MARERLILTSCGTSLLTHGADQALRRRLIESANCRDPHHAAAAPIAERVAEVGTQLASASGEAARRLSAEVNGLLAFEGGAGPGPGDHHILVHTDTLQGEAAANLVAAWLRQGGRVVRPMTAKGLHTASLDDFSTGLADLAKLLVDEIPAWRDRGASVHFNLTGGFKGMQGFLQALGFVLADEVLYIFEGSGALLRIPRLPLSLAADQHLLDHFDLLRRLHQGYAVPVSALGALPETLTFAVDGEAVLSAWGSALFAALAKTRYGEALLEPISDRLLLAPRLQGEVDRLPPDRRALINRQLDRLAALLDGHGVNLDSLGFKPLKGRPARGLTHELYAWSDRDAARLLGRFDDAGRFRVERLVPHL